MASSLVTKDEEEQKPNDFIKSMELIREKRGKHLVLSKLYAIFC